MNKVCYLKHKIAYSGLCLKDFRVSGLLGVKELKNQGFNISGFGGSSVSRFSGIKV
jgi:hypothetical protein